LDIRKEKRLTFLAMYKDHTCFLFRKSNGWSIGYWMDFKTESEFYSWMNERLAEGLVYVGEEAKRVEQYPQVLKLDLKYTFGGYSTVIERFVSKEDYTRYCDDKLRNGYKVIGSEPYLKLEKNVI